MTPYVILISYAVAALAFAAAASLLVVSRGQHRYKGLLLAACVTTAIWAVTVVSGQLWSATAVGVVAVALEQMRSLGWIAALGFVLFIAYRKHVDRAVVIIAAAATAIAVGYTVGLAIYSAAGGATPEIAVKLTFIARIAVALVGLLLVENLFRNSGAEARWAVKYLCFGAGAIFMFDFYIYAEATLFGAIDAQSYAARGLVNAIAAPLIILAAVRSESWPIDLHVSRQMVFRSATLLAAGCYLVFMSLVGFSLRALDGAWGAVTQAVFLTCAGLVLAGILSSGNAQARLKGFISRNFFTYKYDYRKEWLQFIAGISDSSSNLPMPERVSRALADIVESTGGVLWVLRDDAYRPIAAFNMGINHSVLTCDDPFLAHLAAQPGVVAVKTAEIDGAPCAVPLSRALREHNRAWLVLPLLHTNGLVGFVLLGEPRVAVRLSWEDFELLKTAARQAASYIAEAEAAYSLAQAKRFEEFNQQFAFVVHDIKNLAGQMSLMVKNAERHGDNPEFQKDMLRTVGHCATRMRTLLEQIKGRTVAPVEKAGFDAVAHLARLAQTWRLQIPRLHIELPAVPLLIEADAERVETVLNHLLQNASDAAGAEGDVGLELRADSADWAAIIVSDNGPGMEPAFVETKLFQPLTSVKASGFGIGAFQIRQIVREIGGRLEVDSALGQGTRMIVRLPRCVSTPQDDVPQLKVSNG